MNPSSEQVLPVEKGLRGTDGVQTKITVPRSAVSHVDYWGKRLRKRTYQDRDGNAVETPEWYLRLKEGGAGSWFNLGTANHAAAAAKAKEIGTFALANGLKAAIEKFKAPNEEKIVNPTLQEFAELYRTLLDRIEDPPGRQSSERYLKDLFLICRHLHISRIRSLTTDKVKEFVRGYLEDGRQEGREEESIKVSCNSIQRNVGALFSRKMIEEYRAAGLKLANPFAGTKLKRIKLKAYTPISRQMLDNIWKDAALLRDGDPTAPRPEGGTGTNDAPQKRWKEPDFGKPQTSAYGLLLLELGLGLRRHEADKAQWDWFFESNGRHYLDVKETPFFRPKSKESRTLPVEPVLYEAIQNLRGAVISPFIVPGRTPKQYARGHAPKNLVYRCDQHHRTLAFWLRQHGIAEEKPCHLLRKEFGSYVATAFGLFHAQRMLGHSSPQVTSDFYAGLTQLPELNHAKIVAFKPEREQQAASE